MRTRSLRAVARTPCLADDETAAPGGEAPSVKPDTQFSDGVTGGNFPAQLKAVIAASGRAIAASFTFATSLTGGAPFFFGVAAVALLLVGALSYRATDVARESDALVRHTHAVLENIERVHLAAVNVESNARAYVITGQASYEESRRAGVVRLVRDVAQLRTLTMDNAAQHNRLLALERLFAERIRMSEVATALRRSAGFDAAVASTRFTRNFEVAREIDALALAMRGAELRLLAQRAAEADRRSEQTRAIVIFAFLLAGLIAAAACWRVYRDAVRRRTAEHALRYSEDQYQALVQGIEDYAIVMLDPAGLIVSWNTGAERMTGSPADDVVGKSISTFFLPEGEVSGSVGEILRLAAANGSHHTQGVRIRENGTLFNVSSTFRVVHDAKGIFRGFSVIARDLTESTEAGVKYRGLLEAAPDAMVVVDQSGEIVLLNVQAEKQFGYRRDELVGQPVTNIIPEGFAERLIADGVRSAADALAQQIGTGIELTALRKDGSEFPIELMLSPLESPDGVLVTAAIRNISVRKAAETVLAQMEGRYRGLMEAAPDAMVVVNQAGEIVLLNVQAEKQFGYRRDELLDQNVKNIIPVGFAERLVADGLRSADEALAQQIGTGIELTALRKNGSEFPIEIMLSPLDSPEGVLVTAAIRNISVRKAAEKVLAQMEGRYRGLLEAAPDAMVVVNQAGEIVLLNVQAEKQFGYRRDELLGQNVKNIIPEGFAERLVADGLRSAEEALAQQIGAGIELTALRKDGSKFPIELMLSPLSGAEGVLVTAAIRNISIRKNAERHLAQMEGRYRGLLEAAPDAMVVVNQAGEIVLLNLQAEKQFGYRRNELLGQKVENIIPQGFAERLVADGLRSAEEALAQQIGMGIELTALRKDGSEFPIELMLSPLGGAEGILVTAAIRDITARKSAEAHLLQNVEELNRSNEELGQFAYIASHDLQEPLRMVASYTRLLSRRYKGQLDAQADEFIDFAEDGANRMQRLILDLLAYSRIGTVREERREIKSEIPLGLALMNLRGAIDESGAIVTHGPLPLILGDEMQLIQLFQNLVGNAIKYQGPGVPQIHVSAALDGGKKWVFSVHDNGLGIDPQYFEKIFGMFQRLHRREEFDGTGIGLAICKKIVERHGGVITVESQPGQGSTFRFALAAA